MDHACRGLLTQRGYDGKLSAELMVMNSAVPQFFLFSLWVIVYLPCFIPLGGKEHGFIAHSNVYSFLFKEFIAKFVST